MKQEIISCAVSLQNLPLAASSGCMATQKYPGFPQGTKNSDISSLTHMNLDAKRL